MTSSGFGSKGINSSGRSSCGERFPETIRLQGRVPIGWSASGTWTEAPCGWASSARWSVRERRLRCRSDGSRLSGFEPVRASRRPGLSGTCSGSSRQEIRPPASTGNRAPVPGRAWSACRALCRRGWVRRLLASSPGSTPKRFLRESAGVRRPRSPTWASLLSQPRWKRAGRWQPQPRIKYRIIWTKCVDCGLPNRNFKFEVCYQSGWARCLYWPFI